MNDVLQEQIIIYEQQRGHYVLMNTQRSSDKSGVSRIFHRCNENSCRILCVYVRFMIIYEKVPRVNYIFIDLSSDFVRVDLTSNLILSTTVYEIIHR